MTPFAAPVLDRALHSLIVGYVRQRDILTKSPSPNPFPADLISQFKEKVLERVSSYDKRKMDKSFIFEVLSVQSLASELIK